MRTIEDFLVHFRRQRDWTHSLVAVIPEEHFDWRPHKTAFSCGGVVRHLMLSEGFWQGQIPAALAGEPFDPFGLEGTGVERFAAFRPINLSASRNDRQGRLGSTFARCLERWREIQARTEAILSPIRPEQLAEVVVDHPLMALRLPLWEMLLYMVNHEVHHRGQLSAYLKVLGVEQPAMLGMPGMPGTPGMPEISA